MSDALANTQGPQGGDAASEKDLYTEVCEQKASDFESCQQLQAKVDAEGDIRDTTTSKEADQKYLADLTTPCKVAVTAENLACDSETAGWDKEEATEDPRQGEEQGSASRKSPGGIRASPPA